VGADRVVDHLAGVTAHDQAVVDHALLHHGPVAVDLHHRDPLDVVWFCARSERDTRVEVALGLGNHRIELTRRWRSRAMPDRRVRDPAVRAKRAFQ
jgi:hypothetical protein